MAKEETACRFVPESQYIMAGWGCCKCSLYNGVWRATCRGCQHGRCITIAPDVIEHQNKIRRELGYTDD